MNEPYLILVLVGVLLIAIGVPMILRRVPPNPIYGLRVPATFKDEQVWYDANAASGRDCVVLGIVSVLFALVPPALGWNGESHLIGWAVVVSVGALAMAVVGWRRANRMLRARVGGGAQERHS